MSKKLSCRTLSAIAVLCVFDCARADSDGYLDRIRSSYPVVFVAKIDQGSTVRTNTGNQCFFKYETGVESTIKGGLSSKKFAFYSESRLTLGASYLVYFSEVDAKKYRILVSYSDIQTDPKCKTLRSGYLLVPEETHKLRDEWDGKALRSYVELSDSEMSSISDHAIHKASNLVDFDYVKSELAKH